MSEPVVIRAHAKVNLALAVGPPEPSDGPRAGWHPIRTWMHAIDLHDDVRVEHAETTSYTIAWDDGSPVDWPAGRDLAVRAHQAVETHLGRPLPVRLSVTKRIPAGGGLGGGSADAGATILAIDTFFGLGLNPGVRTRLAFSLGSDVGFFAETQPPKPAIVSGFGERADRLDPHPAPITLVCPPFGCATPAVYAAFDADQPRSTWPERAARIDALASGPPAPEQLFNDLAEPADRVEPRLGELRRRLASALGVPVHVSGSGSTLFVLGEVSERVRSAAPSCRALHARLV